MIRTRTPDVSPFYHYFLNEFGIARNGLDLGLKDNGCWDYIRYIPTVGGPEGSSQVDEVFEHLRQWVHIRLTVDEDSDYTNIDPVIIYNGPPIEKHNIVDGASPRRVWSRSEDCDVALNIFTSNLPAGWCIYSYLSDFVNKRPDLRGFVTSDHFYNFRLLSATIANIRNEMRDVTSAIDQIRAERHIIFHIWYFVLMKGRIDPKVRRYLDSVDFQFDE